MAPSARAEARVDLAAVRANCERLAAELTGGAKLCAVVKADGYGHGASACAGAALAGGATWLAVATAAEAIVVRGAHPDADLLTLGALTIEEVDAALAARSEISIWRPEFVAAVAARAAAIGRPARVHLKVDSGMGRLGQRDPDAVLEIARVCAADPDLELAGVWTHFATADEPEDEFFDEQLGRFDRVAAAVRAEFPDVIAHAANSAAVFRDSRSHHEMARCGVAVYGLDPFQGDPVKRGLTPALSLHTYVADVKRLEDGASAGYGRTWRARGERWIGVLPLGYGDGVRRALSNRAEVLVGGRRRPVVGTISMDNLTIDLGPEPDVEPGAEAVLIGSQGDEAIRAEEIAESLATINYEVTCGLSARVPRVPA